MNRQKFLDQARTRDEPWDLLIIGGGATGLGSAVDAASRGYRVLLLEQHDFAKGTSSRSTKLVHGGVRYLQQGNISLVLEALRERGLLTRNAPHLVHHQAFIVPNYTWWEAPFYGIGMKLYDMLAGKLGLGASKHLSRQAVLERIPTLEEEGLRGGVVYYDGQFDDSRLALTLARTAARHDAVLLNYTKVIRLLKSNDLVHGVVAVDQESGQEFEVHAKVVINATGVFSDGIRRMDDPQAASMIAPSQGVHIVLDREFLPLESAIMVPKTDDGRVLFAIPWHGRVLVGTTDTPVTDCPLEPRALPEEIAFLLKHAGKYLKKAPGPEDVLSLFAGLRPLVKLAGGSGDTSVIPRDHTLVISRSGLLTVAGGKWTTYRRMAEDTINEAIGLGGLEERACRTKELRLHGWQEDRAEADVLQVYGSDAEAIRELAKNDPGLAKPLHPRLPYLSAEVVWAVRNEMARTVEDVLARRTRALLLDAKASMEAAEQVADLMAAELGRDKQWRTDQVRQYRALAGDYLLPT